MSLNTEKNKDSVAIVAIDALPKSANIRIPKNRQDVLKWNGWGYSDSGFRLRDGLIEFSGNRYPIGNFCLPYFTQWVVEKLGADLSQKNQAITEQQIIYPAHNVEVKVLEELDKFGLQYSLKGEDRGFRSHGHTISEIYDLRIGKLPRIPDCVVWPENHDDVEKLVHIAKEYDVALIPFGGGTSVTGGVTCPKTELRTIMSVDTSQMNRILWIDEKNLLCCAQSGIVGQDLEAQLLEKGYTCGHEPDSYEFSTLGGWVATRASGMKKNTYGNIEDLLVHAKMVSANGTLEKYCSVPRLSAGPDIHHFILGSEGTLGIITEVVLKIREIPRCKKYGSIVFPTFLAGVSTLREIAKQRCQPSSIRLMDNEQFKFGHSLRSPSGMLGSVKESAKSVYLTKFKGFDINQICVATLLFEGTKDQVEAQERKVYSIASQFQGLAAGSKAGERGYILTFVIAYIRDLGLDYNIVAESFETSVPWNSTFNLCENVKLRVTNECKDRGLKHFFITCRVTQTYDSGACVYFYFAFNYRGISDPIKVFEEIEGIARDEILLNRGSISHHHGVGKIRKRWLANTISETGVNAIQHLKKAIDPTNIFAANNVFSLPHKDIILKAKL